MSPDEDHPTEAPSMTMTVQDVLDAVERSAELTPTQRRDIPRASTVAGLIGRPPRWSSRRRSPPELVGEARRSRYLGRPSQPRALARALGIVGLVDQVLAGSRRHPVWGALVALLLKNPPSLGTAAS